MRRSSDNQRLPCAVALADWPAPEAKRDQSDSTDDAVDHRGRARIELEWRDEKRRAEQHVEITHNAGRFAGKRGGERSAEIAASSGDEDDGRSLLVIGYRDDELPAIASSPRRRDPFPTPVRVVSRWRPESAVHRAFRARAGPARVRRAACDADAAETSPAHGSRQ